MSSASDQAVAAARAESEANVIDKALTEAVRNGIAGAAPPFNTHSVALAGKLNAEAEGYKSQVADVDAKIAALQAERTDLMLAYSMLSAAMGARERNQ